MMERGIDELLRRTVLKKGSDLHIAVAKKPCIRINGALAEEEDWPPLKPQEVEDLLNPILREEQKAHLREAWELDFSYAIQDCGRFRGNIIWQRGTLAAVFRAVPFIIPKFEDLGLPEDARRLCSLTRGLVLVTGPTGSGKSTTLAAMVNLINETHAHNIVTVEDPIEFLHSHKRSIVRQREIGTDTHSFANALRQVLRHDPDVIMIGEMRDIESIGIAVTAAETGHLVFSTLHTQTAPLTISRIIDSFPEGQRQQIRQQLANSLRAVISQKLMPTADGQGRVAAIEYMIDTPAVRSIIREGKEHQLYSSIQTGHNVGMQTLDQALLRLMQQGKAARKDALENAVDRSELERLIRQAAF
jgi:twitching motility protein PilT